ALGPQLPGWLRRLGAAPTTARETGEPARSSGSHRAPLPPVADTLDDHLRAIADATAAGADLICTTGGTMHGPVDHLHPALAALGGEYLVNTVAVRPGYPMLLARLPRP